MVKIFLKTFLNVRGILFVFQTLQNPEARALVRKFRFLIHP